MWLVLISLVAIQCIISSAQNENGTEAKIEAMHAELATLSRQLMMQQFASEERIRSEGGSGIKIRTGKTVANIHDHSPNVRTLGQGVTRVVVHGVDFRTRHNDYPLHMASTTSGDYKATVPVPFPEVPPEVLKKKSVNEQIVEMRAWFKAWQDQNYSVRDYRKYFKPLLCYLETGWFTNTKDVEEPFFSSRHQLEAKTWHQLQEKFRFSSYTGKKNIRENGAYLPTTVINITATGSPVYAQWNYRILCHPLSRDVPLRFLSLVDDLSGRLRQNMDSEKEHSNSRFARFKLRRSNHIKKGVETLMQEIPGMDNYPANITDNIEGDLLYRIDDHYKVLNTGYYHKGYIKKRKDASGLRSGTRAAYDPGLYFAETTQPGVAPMYIRQLGQKRQYFEELKRMTYAIPLEIVFLTPLSEWNPYNIKYVDKEDVTDNNKRKGLFTPETAYKAASHNKFYRTPIEFFTGKEVTRDKADTTKDVVGVLDQNGVVRKCAATGIRIFMRNIPGVGSLRTRYPIMPVHGEDSPVWKEINALREIVFNMKSYSHYLNERPAFPGEAENNEMPVPTKPPRTTPVPNLLLTTSRAYKDPPGDHDHTIELTPENVSLLKKGETVRVSTSMDYGHLHDVRVQYRNGRYELVDCDDRSLPCWDGHNQCLFSDTQATCNPSLSLSPHQDQDTYNSQDLYSLTSPLSFLWREIFPGIKTA